MKQPTFVELRRKLLGGKKRLSQIIDLGWGVLDANVRTSLLVCHRWNGHAFDALDVADREDRNDLIIEACSQRLFIQRSHDETLDLPKSVLGLNLPAKAHGQFIALDRISSLAELPWGCGANDSVRLFRLRWEVRNRDIGDTWAFLTNGGEFAPLYRENYFVCRVRVENGESAFTTKFKNESDFLYDASAQHLYYKAGLTYPKRSRFFHLAALPAGHIFTPEGKGFFLEDADNRLLSLAILNSSVVAQMADFLCGPHKQRGDVELIGVPKVSVSAVSRIKRSAEAALVSLQSLAEAKEDSALFCVPWQRNQDIEDFDSFHRLAVARQHQVEQSSQIVADAFLDFDAAGQEACPWLPLDEDCISELHTARRKVFDSYALGVDSYISYLLGCSLGRWDIRYATGDSQPPELPDPFSPLPACSPGMLQGKAGLPAESTDIPPNYPLRISWPGILVVDQNHPEDVVSRVLEAVEVIWKDRFKTMGDEASSFLGVSALSDYFLNPAAFFAVHLSLYSKSRRQAPIYWMLSTGNGNYCAWLYYHRFTSDTLYRLLRDFVEPRIQEAEREHFELESEGGLTGDAARLLQEAQSLLQDLRLFKSELELVAPLWNPNLNDGVIINHAILWRITPYTPWQKKCKECWDKLVKGNYDWAHLAFHLWPERVIGKCTTDRSLAIAHGLEDRLWQETSKGNWLQRQVSEVELQALLAQYRKPAVQNALERFLAASPPVAAARTRTPRAAKLSSTGSTRRPRGSASAVDPETSRQTLLVLTAAPADGLGRNAIAELLGLEAASLTAVIKQLKEGGQIEQLGAARGAKYRLTESGLAAVESQAGENQEA